MTPARTDLGTHAWVERTGGRLTAAERRQPAPAAGAHARVQRGRPTLDAAAGQLRPPSTVTTGQRRLPDSVLTRAAEARRSPPAQPSAAEPLLSDVRIRRRARRPGEPGRGPGGAVRGGAAARRRAADPGAAGRLHAGQRPRRPRRRRAGRAVHRRDRHASDRHHAAPQPGRDPGTRPGRVPAVGRRRPRRRRPALLAAAHPTCSPRSSPRTRGPGSSGSSRPRSGRRRPGCRTAARSSSAGTARSTWPSRPPRSEADQRRVGHPPRHSSQHLGGASLPSRQGCPRCLTGPLLHRACPGLLAGSRSCEQDPARGDR